MVSVFDEIRKQEPINPPKIQDVGYMWLNVLIKFSLDGKTEIVRSFAKPAKESTIKNIGKTKKEETKLESKTTIKTESLF